MVSGGDEERSGRGGRRVRPSLNRSPLIWEIEMQTGRFQLSVAWSLSAVVWCANLVHLQVFRVVCVCVRVCVRVCVSQWWCVLPQNGNRKNSLEVYWDSSPDMSLLTLPSLNTLTHTHTHTQGHGWYHLHLQLTHSLGLSGDTQARAPRAFPESQATRTQMLSF